MKKYCDCCQSEQETQVISKRETLPVRGEEFETISDIRVCTICGEELFDEELDTANLERVYEAYRRKHNFLFAIEIKQIRESIGSGRTVATLLGWSQATLVRYEGGAIPSAAHHEQLLRLKNDPSYLKYLFDLNGHKLKERDCERIQAIINKTELPDQGPVEYLNKIFAHFYNTGITNVEFDFDKLTAMVQLFAQYNHDLVKTKLQKLLYYADNLNVKRYGYPITGLAFIHHHFGPVPAHHDLIYWALQTVGAIDVKPYDGPYEGEIIIPIGECDKELFTDEELDVILTVANYFKDFTATRISDFSHKEKGYVETEQKQIIPFSYADSLTLN
ncbi:type II TA system antitoxin MqsA family protein [Desulfitobacterium sp.]|uniref:type II TA system antitoxin MqsA family protein n=1 Tax=Desulfitobacterium sp. TaxID=49981 RepID=UPI002BFC3898|nr:type II TA system antitoxin MqsA family protein [Desulfitobacterium sp.]HVJ49292.1 type II TA system antitoxin MqsA family protein [Desulfitobacterium sp.]